MKDDVESFDVKSLQKLVVASINKGEKEVKNSTFTMSDLASLKSREFFPLNSFFPCIIFLRDMT